MKKEFITLFFFSLTIHYMSYSQKVISSFEDKAMYLFGYYAKESLSAEFE